jgi:hypothetical protein
MFREGKLTGSVKKHLISLGGVCVRVCVRARCEKALLMLRCVLEYMGHGAGSTFVLSTISSILHRGGGLGNVVYLGQWELAKF